MQSRSQLVGIGYEDVDGVCCGNGNGNGCQEVGPVPGTCSGIVEQRTGQNCACIQFQVCAARGLFEKAIPSPPAYQSTHPSAHPFLLCLSSEKYATLSWTRLCCCCFISPLPSSHHIPHILLGETGNFGQVNGKGKCPENPTYCI